jgi:protein TonB
MPHELFEEITTPTSRGSARSPYTIALSIAAHVAVIGVVVIVPLLAVDALPKPVNPGGIFVPVVHVPPAPPPARRATPPTPTQSDVAPRSIPLAAPDGVHDEAPPASPASAPTIGDTAGRPDGDIGSISDSLGRPEPPPKPTPAPTPINVPVPVGGQIREPQKVFGVAPAYPSIARDARIQGVVVIQAVIGVDGAVREARIQSGSPLLDQAALDAVRQWRYRPTLLNGVPVPVIMTVSVRFTLQ